MTQIYPDDLWLRAWVPVAGSGFWRHDRGRQVFGASLWAGQLDRCCRANPGQGGSQHARARDWSYTFDRRGKCGAPRCLQIFDAWPAQKKGRVMEIQYSSCWFHQPFITNPPPYLSGFINHRMIWRSSHDVVLNMTTLEQWHTTRCPQTTTHH